MSDHIVQDIALNISEDEAEECESPKKHHPTVEKKVLTKTPQNVEQLKWLAQHDVPDNKIGEHMKMNLPYDENEVSAVDAGYEDKQQILMNMTNDEVEHDMATDESEYENENYVQMNMNNDEVEHEIPLGITHQEDEQFKSMKKSSKTQFSCGVCGRTFRRSEQLSKHMLIHTGDKPYKCEVCDKGFCRLENLRNHRFLHSGEKPLKCNLCGKRYSRSYDLRKHELVHTGEKPHECELCGKGFTKSCDLKRHALIHTGIKPHVCEICGRGFTRRSNLARHSLTHAHDKVDKRKLKKKGDRVKKKKTLKDNPYQCNVCFERFPKLEDLGRHTFTHTEGKPFECKICGKCFTTIEELVGHELRHKEKNSFSKIDNVNPENINEDFTDSSGLILPSSDELGEISCNRNDEISDDDFNENSRHSLSGSDKDTFSPDTFNVNSMQVYQAPDENEKISFVLLNDKSRHIFQTMKEDNEISGNDSYVNENEDEISDDDFVIDSGPRFQVAHNKTKLCNDGVSESPKHDFQISAVKSKLSNEHSNKNYKYTGENHIKKSGFEETCRVNSGNSDEHRDISETSLLSFSGSVKSANKGMDIKVNDIVRVSEENDKISSKCVKEKSELCSDASKRDIESSHNNDDAIVMNSKPTVQISDVDVKIAKKTCNEKLEHSVPNSHRKSKISSAGLIARSRHTCQGPKEGVKISKKDASKNSDDFFHASDENELDCVKHIDLKENVNNLSESKIPRQSFTEKVEQILHASNNKDDLSNKVHDSKYIFQSSDEKGEIPSENSDHSHPESYNEKDFDDDMIENAEHLVKYSDKDHFELCDKTKPDNKVLDETDIKKEPKELDGIEAENGQDFNASLYDFTFQNVSDQKKHKCDICNRTYMSQSGLRRHKLVHADHKHKCEVCDRTFTRHDSLASHVLIHTGDRPYHCSLCDKTFKRSSDVHRHMYSHLEEKSFKCDVCNSFFKTPVSLRRHKAKHKNEKLYRCEVCHSAFSELGLLSSHLLTHSGDESYQCLVCGDNFTTLSDIARHKLTHDGDKLYKCEQCDMEFSTYDDLRIHKVIHTKMMLYKCDICDAVFKRSNDRNRHVAMHSEDKPFSCDICFKAFKTPRHLKSHQMLHTEEKLHTCDICFKTFKTANYMRRHRIGHSREQENESVESFELVEEMESEESNESMEPVESV